MTRLLVPLGLLVLFMTEVLRVYFIMPFPGSQRSDTVSVAYFLHKYGSIIRIAGLLMVAMGAYYYFRGWKNWKKVLFIFGILLYGAIAYLVNFKFMADKMFYQPKQKTMLASGANKVGHDKLVLGVTINNESKAYPIELIGYHHQVQDTIGGEPVLITYCTVCRTGRVFSPVVNGKKESFRLVGMDHFNAMFEDEATKSWWRQATGEAITGKRKGERLKEIPSQQMRLSAWLRANPQSLVMQPDPAFAKRYADLAGFDLGTIKSGLEKRDSGSWQFKSWVVGVRHNDLSKAYDWNNLVVQKIINDSLNGLKLVIAIEEDNSSFHVWNRVIKGQSLNFVADSAGMRDKQTMSLWNMDGVCTAGIHLGERLQPVQASQEFWHSWQTFNPGTKQHK
jgi:hypothetical protein